jgi:glycosyltransferase involved in cell wall biosynthesis
MLFDLEFTGHHPHYIRHIVNFWQLAGNRDQLTIVVSPEFVDRHKAIVGMNYAEIGSINISFHPISIQDADSLNYSSRVGRILRRLREWQLLCKYASIINADHCLVMFIDKLQLPIILGFQPPCPISGIYFQPSFHYDKLVVSQSKGRDKKILRKYFKNLRDFFFLNQANRNPKLKHLFVLDPYAVEYIQNQYKGFECIHLPDPIEPYKSAPTVSSNSRSLVEQGRTAFLIFGYLDERKGISKFLNTIEILPDEACKKMCLILAGQLSPSLERDLPERLAHVINTRSIQLICDFDFISDEKAYLYFQMADIILAIYQNHLGMSGILLMAATMQKPVLSQNYGLMGQLVRDFGLGLDVDSTDPPEIAACIQYIFSMSIQKIGDRNNMINFVKNNSPELFFKTIVSTICSDFESIEL